MDAEGASALEYPPDSFCKKREKLSSPRAAFIAGPLRSALSRAFFTLCSNALDMLLTGLSTGITILLAGIELFRKIFASFMPKYSPGNVPSGIRARAGRRRVAPRSCGSGAGRVFFCPVFVLVNILKAGICTDCPEAKPGAL
jgi:hypothetical protein